MSDYAALIAPEDKIEAVRRTVGHNIQQILSNQPRFDLYEILGSIEVLVGSKIHRQLSTSLSERIVFASTWLAREVQTGGFRQFFVNSAGDFWQDVLQGLVVIGDQAGESTFRRTLSIFQNSTPSSRRQERLEQLNALEEENEEKLSAHLSDMTSLYFRNPFPKWDLLFKYVKAHPDRFVLENA